MLTIPLQGSCESADLGVEVLDHEAGWSVTDLSGRIRVSPYWSSATSGLTIAQEDIGLDAYYWEVNINMLEKIFAAVIKNI